VIPTARAVGYLLTLLRSYLPDLLRGALTDQRNIGVIENLRGAVQD